jgi:hypothetical protein
MRENIHSLLILRGGFRRVSPFAEMPLPLFLFVTMPDSPGTLPQSVEASAPASSPAKTSCGSRRAQAVIGSSGSGRRAGRPMPMSIGCSSGSAAGPCPPCDQGVFPWDSFAFARPLRRPGRREEAGQPPRNPQGRPPAIPGTGPAGAESGLAAPGAIRPPWPAPRSTRLLRGTIKLARTSSASRWT